MMGHHCSSVQPSTAADNNALLCSLLCALQTAAFTAGQAADCDQHASKQERPCQIVMSIIACCVSTHKSSVAVNDLADPLRSRKWYWPVLIGVSLRFWPVLAQCQSATASANLQGRPVAHLHPVSALYIISALLTKIMSLNNTLLTQRLHCSQMQ